ncbi:TPA: helix-turn-helix transcriptional regulator [Clostridioides difficile]|uniref:helix-turn-helix domain-containing protein n=1 Tax=Clostridioides difficile TaxID=1496 RepID=UPI001C1824B7|nr:helix-turn-helix transcriptional regulator [Clostridioides difficile]MCD8633531.1 helix-turn-helix transcriptional regulator [Clostridioides difficile]MCG3626814.1 helix-turn-helix transcriptional regulator [Clostridioides difficile]MCO4709828.1 helix-turn-helix transcriptional regulator [Clostridioides difficile]MCP8337845.1 helix-turn-helix transcriptional regulator [Clostridioides difficile]MCP8383253.1 helix-turn-helix transcriptional regulator [Clostridioides difficile]
MNIDYLGERIRERRKELGITIEQLAERVGIGYNHLSNIERGRKIPSLETFIKIVNELDTTSDIILKNYVKYAKPHLQNDIVAGLENLDSEGLKIVSDVLSALIKNLSKTRDNK